MKFITEADGWHTHLVTEMDRAAHCLMNAIFEFLTNRMRKA